MSRVNLASFGETHKGNVREANEDTLLVDRELGLYAVFDGMGGASSGDVASSKSRDVVHDFVRQHRTQMNPGDLLKAALVEAAKAVYTEARSRRDRHGMGTTAVVYLATSESTGVLAHVGDSRGYLLRDRNMQLLTRDHTVVAELIANGAISAEEAQHHPYKSVLSRNIGAKPTARVDLMEVSMNPGDKLLLCSDGLHGFASHDAVAQVLGGCESPGHASRELIALALKGGGGDNVTAVVLELGEAQLPRQTLIIRQSGSVAWWQRRPQFLQAAAHRGLASSPLCAVLSAEEAVEILAGNLCEAIYHDLEHTSGINVWTYAENLANGWLDQSGGDENSYQPLRELLDVLRAAAIDVLASMNAEGAAVAVALESAVLRSFTVLEMAVGGTLADRLRSVEKDIENALLDADRRRQQTQTGQTSIEQPTIPYMRAMRVDPPSPDVAACLQSAHRSAEQQIHRLAGQHDAEGMVQTMAERLAECLRVCHRLCTETVGDAGLGARELYASAALEDGSVIALLEALATARAAHLEAIRTVDLSATSPAVRAASLRRAATAHQRLFIGVCRLAVDAGKPIGDALRAAAEKTAALRTQLGQGESRLAKRERMMATQIDGSPPAGWGGKP